MELQETFGGVGLSFFRSSYLPTAPGHELNILVTSQMRPAAQNLDDPTGTKPGPEVPVLVPVSEWTRNCHPE